MWEGDRRIEWTDAYTILNKVPLYNFYHNQRHKTMPVGYKLITSNATQCPHGLAIFQNWHHKIGKGSGQGKSAFR